MGLYGSEFINEAFFNKTSADLIKQWKTSNEANRIKKFKSTSLTSEEYQYIDECLNVMINSDQYGEYKKAFVKFCKFCHILPTGVIIRKYELKKGKGDSDNSLYVEYAENTKTIKLPEGTKLYHISKVAGIEKLVPQYKGKSEKGYFYDKQRIYFTIKKEMLKFLADYKATDQMHKYLCKKDITEVYVDPLVWSNTQGAVYVETTSPIPVEEVGLKGKQKEAPEKEDKQQANNPVEKIELSDKDKEGKIEAKDKSENESAFNFDDFFTFVSENGFLPSDL